MSWNNEYKNFWIKEIAIRIRQSIRNGYLVSGPWREKILYYLNLKKFCTPYRGKCVRVKNNKIACEWCGAIGKYKK